MKTATTKVEQFIDYGINIATTLYTVLEDVKEIIGKNVEASAGICIGMGFATEYKSIGIEAISRMDIVGVQLKDGKLRIGHPGKSAVNITVPTSDPLCDVTLGPQNNTYEDFGINYREADDTIYYDFGKSEGQAAAFIIGYHYDVSISYKGILEDLIEYFE